MVEVYHYFVSETVSQTVVPQAFLGTHFIAYIVLKTYHHSCFNPQAVGLQHDSPSLPCSIIFNLLVFHSQEHIAVDLVNYVFMVSLKVRT